MIPMPRLAIDTSSVISSVAVTNASGLTFSIENPSRDSHSQSLAQMVKDVVEQAGINSFSEFSEILIGLGPGSFTGLRIGLSYAKGMSLVHRTPLSGVSSFAAMAMAAAQDGDLIGVMSDARRDEYFFAGFRCTLGGIEEVQPVIICSAKEITIFFEREKATNRVICVDAGNEKIPQVAALVQPAQSIAVGVLKLPQIKSEWSMATLAALEPMYTRAVAALTVVERVALHRGC
jgi:tRNA threonylcarbamoyladenosine biosynthesis protein TsaB